MKRPLQTLLLIACCFLVTAVNDASADNTDKEQAQKLLSEGNTLLASGDNNGALAKFEAAYAAYESPSLLLNIGTTLRALGRNAEAANAYAQWVRAKQNPERLAEVEEALAELDQKLGGVRIEINKPGASVTIDGTPVKAELLADVVRLEPGPHVIIAKKSGLSDVTRRVDVSAGAQKTVKIEFDLVAAGTTTGAGSESSSDAGGEESTGTGSEMIDSPAPSAGRGMRFAGLGVAGVGLLSVAVAVKFGLDSKNISNELDEHDGAWTSELLAKEDEGKSAETKMIVFAAVGGVAIAAGATLYVLGHMAGKRAEESIALTPVLSDDTVGWAVSGSF